MHPPVSVTHPPPRGLWATSRGEHVTKISVFWWTPVRQNITMPGPETELYCVKWHSGVIRRRCAVAGCAGLALGAFSGPPCARPEMLHLASLNGSPGRLGRAGPGCPKRGWVALLCLYHLYPVRTPCQGCPKLAPEGAWIHARSFCNPLSFWNPSHFGMPFM